MDKTDIVYVVVTVASGEGGAPIAVFESKESADNFVEAATKISMHRLQVMEIDLFK